MSNELKDIENIPITLTPADIWMQRDTIVEENMRTHELKTRPTKHFKEALLIALQDEDFRKTVKELLNE